MQTTMILLAGLASAAPEAPNSQELSVERAARQYRIHAYDTYREDRETYDHVRSAGDELLANWQDAGQPGDHCREVLGWYQNAARNTLAESLPSLPKLPISVTPEPEANVNIDVSDPIQSTPYENAQPVTPQPIESSEVLLESSEQADQANEPDDLLPLSTSAAPVENGTRTLGEKWSNSPKSLSTLGKFAVGVAGF